VYGKTLSLIVNLLLIAGLITGLFIEKRRRSEPVSA